MTHTKNGIPIYEEQQIINEETVNIQQILNQFKQPIPDEFTELGQPKKHWGSTEDWKEPVCERYSFKHNNKLITLDVDQELSNKLELTLEDNFYVISDALTLKDDNKEEIIITIKNEKEIFIQRPLTIDNLDKNLTKVFEKLEESQETIEDLQKRLEESEKNRSDWKNEWLKEWRKNKQIQERTNDLEREIQEKDREVNHQKELIEKGTKINEKLQKELEKLKSKRRDWQSFYEWLINNIVDKNESSFVKKEWKKKYERLDWHSSQYFRCLFELLENTVGVRDVNLPIKNYSGYESGYQKILNPYKDSERFSDFYLWPEAKGFESWVVGEYDRLIDNWKKDTSLQNK